MKKLFVVLCTPIVIIAIIGVYVKISENEADKPFRRVAARCSLQYDEYTNYWGYVACVRNAGFDPVWGTNLKALREAKIREAYGD